jgi:hypothetical protein
MSRVVELYRSGASLPQVSKALGVSISTARKVVLEAGELRNRADAIRLARQQGRCGHGRGGGTYRMSEAARQKLSASKLALAEGSAAGVSLKPNGYLEYTRGPHKGRLVHVVAMETRIGRRLRPDECVHHIDENKTNNADNNLALMTRSGHTRHHRRS